MKPSGVSRIAEHCQNRLFRPNLIRIWILTHNHPGGTCAPSPENISSTIQLQRLLNGIGILLLDHVIVSGDNTYSLVQHGDIDYRVKGVR